MTQPSSTPQLALNVAAIDYPKSVVVAYAEEFNSTDEIPAIRKRYCGTHFVRRFEKSRVLVLPLRADSPALSTPVKVDLSSASLWLIAALIRESLLNYLFSIDRKIIGLKPITFIDTKTDLLQQANQSKPKNDIISVRPAIAIDVVVFEFDTGARFVGSALIVRGVNSFDAPYSTLLVKCINLSGLYVGFN